MDKMKTIKHLFPFTFCILNVAFATIIHIPEDYPTIQQGIDAAFEGDTVLVVHGEYFENIQWPSINGIKLIGSGYENTIINGFNNGSVISIEATGIIDNTTVIKGFTIRNGLDGYGGGINCINSTPTLENLKVSNNQSFWGGGINFDDCVGVTLKNVIIVDNFCEVWGGGIFLNLSEIKIEDSEISSNYAIERGGGICFLGGSELDLNNVKIKNNISTERGGGIYAESSDITLTATDIIQNTATFGGGIYFYGHWNEVSFT